MKWPPPLHFQWEVGFKLLPSTSILQERPPWVPTQLLPTPGVTPAPSTGAAFTVATEAGRSQPPRSCLHGDGHRAEPGL